MKSVEEIHQILRDELGIHFEMNELSPRGRELIMRYRKVQNQIIRFGPSLDDAISKHAGMTVSKIIGIISIIFGILVFGICFFFDILIRCIFT